MGKERRPSSKLIKLRHQGLHKGVKKQTLEKKTAFKTSDHGKMGHLCGKELNKIHRAPTARKSI